MKDSLKKSTIPMAQPTPTQVQSTTSTTKETKNPTKSVLSTLKVSLF